MRYQAICFDLDGVIINSESLHEAAFRSALKTYNLSLSTSDYETYFAGKTDQQGFIEYLSSQQTEIPLTELLILKQRAFTSLASNKLTYYEGVPDLIRDIAKIIPLALVTGSSPEETAIALDTQNLAQRFSAIVTAGDITHSKPSPEGYLLAASRLTGSVAPTACIAVEDSPSGIRAAKDAGMYCIAVTNTHTPKQLQMADTIAEQLSVATFTQLINV